MNSVRSFIVLLAGTLTVVAAALHNSNDFLRQNQVMQLRLRQLEIFKANNPLPQPSSDGMSTMELDMEKLATVMEEVMYDIWYILEDANSTIVTVLKDHKETATKIRDTFEDAVYTVYDIYFNYEFMVRKKLVDLKDIPALVELSAFNYKDNVAKTISKSDQIVQDSAIEFLDIVQAVDRKLVKDVNASVQKTLDVIREFTQ